MVVRAAVECVLEYRVTVTQNHRLVEAENALAVLICLRSIAAAAGWQSRELSRLANRDILGRGGVRGPPRCVCADELIE